MDATVAQYKGKVVLIVNVASKCGNTPQYAGLEKLYEEKKDKGLVILGFPCDQFGHQEPGDESEIKSFCSTRYDVTFPMFAKIEVNGANAHPLYQWLKSEKAGILGTEAIKWELWRVAYGVWNYIKNSGNFPDAANYTLEWVGTIPGKRESRRFEGGTRNGSSVSSERDAPRARHY